jgi:sulfur carrier protein
MKKPEIILSGFTRAIRSLAPTRPAVAVQNHCARFCHAQKFSVCPSLDGGDIQNSLTKIAHSNSIADCEITLFRYSTKFKLYPGHNAGQTKLVCAIAVKSPTMKIIINGELRELESGTSLENLVQLLDLQGKRLAIEVNQAIVPRSQFASFQLTEQDQVEIVHAIGGG